MLLKGFNGVGVWEQSPIDNSVWSRSENLCFCTSVCV